MSKKILIVDDDASIRSIVNDMLKVEGHQLVTAACAEDGLELLKKDQKFDLILLDVIMPGMTGLDLLSKIKEGDATANIPVIMLTGEDSSNDIMNGYGRGADYYITKPFNRKQLLYGLSMVFGE